MKNKSKNQQGRSMVEMLAVLAISGVLAITGITAYNYAMIKHQANELVNKANLAYVDVMTRDSLDTWEELKINGLAGVAIQGYIYNDAGFVKITEVDENICNNILNNNQGVSILTLENTTLTTCTDTNDMIFDFGNAGTIGVKCESDSDCIESAGQYCSPHSGVCINEKECTYPTPIWSYTYDRCVTCEKEDPENPLWDEKNENCIACDSATPYYDGKNCTICPDRKPIHSLSDNKCTTCETENALFPVWDTENKECISCHTANKTLPIWNTRTKKCESCPAEKPDWLGNTCGICPENSSAEENDRRINNTDCYCNDGYIIDHDNGTCILPTSNFCYYTATYPTKKYDLTSMSEKVGCPSGYYCSINWSTTACGGLGNMAPDIYGTCITLETPHNTACPN